MAGPQGPHEDGEKDTAREELRVKDTFMCTKVEVGLVKKMLVLSRDVRITTSTLGVL